MGFENLKIVCYTGGTCGDLISALIDPTNSRMYQTVVINDPERCRLKKPHLFDSNSAKDQYISAIIKQYASIPSHDLEYHKNRGHKFISISVNDRDVALWAATRFRALHRPHVWEEMTRYCGAGTVDDYANVLIDYSNMVTQHTNYIVDLKDIINGNGITALEECIQITVSDHGREFYKEWLLANERV